MTIGTRMFTSVLVVTLVTAEPAQTGIIPGLATEWTQLMNNVQLVQKYIRQGEELRQKIRMVMDMDRNSADLPFKMFAPIMKDLNKIKQVVQSGRALAYSMANLDAEFRNRFRGYGYQARAWFRDYKDWSQTSLDTTRSTLRAAGLQAEQFETEEALLEQLRAMSKSSDGRLKALNVANQILEQQVQQMMKLRQLMLVDLQSKQAFQAAQIQKQAATEAGTEKFFNFGGRKGDGRGYQAGR